MDGDMDDHLPARRTAGKALGWSLPGLGLAVGLLCLALWPGCVDKTCEVNPPLPCNCEFTINGQEIYGGMGGYYGLYGDALVTYKTRPTGEWPVTEIGLLFLDEGNEASIRVRLPNHYEIPVERGEVVDANLDADAPWWVSYSVTITGSDGRLRARLWDGSFGFGSEDFQAQCPAKTSWEGCVKEVHPVLTWTYDYSGLDSPVELTLRQGDAKVLEGPDVSYKIFMCSVAVYIDLDRCSDLPPGWIQYATLSSSQVSQCNCYDRFDCALGEVCETEVHRCVRDQCEGISCDPAMKCDPYTGACFDPAVPHVQCENSEDCDSLSGEVCNTYLGVCQHNACPGLGCQGACSPLGSQCYGCLSDCDCPEGDIGDEDTSECVLACDENKLGLTRQNPEAFDRYTACLLGVVRGPAELLGALDSTTSCDATAVVGSCAASETACSGWLDLEAGTGAVTDEMWETLCAMSMMPQVMEIQGVHDQP
jgi:hypothetical protein